MKQVRVEKHGGTRFHLEIDEFQPLYSHLNPLGVRPILTTESAVPYAPDAMRAPQNLEATVFFAGAVNGDHATGHVRAQTSVLIPIAVVLVPLPCAPPRGSFNIILEW
jgi:hypothetical protein